MESIVFRLKKEFILGWFDLSLAVLVGNMHELYMLSILPNLILGLDKLNEIALLLHIFSNDFPTNTFSLVIHRCTHAASYFRSTCFK